MINILLLFILVGVPETLIYKDANQCNICNEFIEFAQDYLTDYTFTQEFVGFLYESICGSLPEGKKEICLSMIETLLPTFLNDLGL